MVATRRGVRKALDDAPAAASTLKAPPKRGGKKKPVVQDTVKSALSITQSTEKCGTKRKATEEPKVADLPAAKKSTANIKATRAVKSGTAKETIPVEARRATRARKAVGPAIVNEPVVVESASESATTRTRMAPVQRMSARAHRPAATKQIVAKETSLPVSRARRAPARKLAALESVEIQAEGTSNTEPVKLAPHGRKAALHEIGAPVPIIATRTTRARNVAVVPQDSPLKAPARKPVKNATNIAVAKSVPDSTEDVFAQHPQYPTTPAHITAPLDNRQTLKELPQYPTTPAHILAPISTKEAILQLPGYPETPAHIRAPITAKTALAELPGYPDTPGHIMAPISIKDAMAELPGYPETPAHIVLPAMLAANEQVDATRESPDDPSGPGQIAQCINTSVAIEQPPAPVAAQSDVQAPSASSPSIKTLMHSVSLESSQELAIQSPCTPEQSATPSADIPTEFFEKSQMPTDIVWGVTNQEAFAELPTYPTTPAHIKAPLTTKRALAELPNYVNTPSNIVGPISNRKALAELPGYLTTPSMAIEAAIQEEITASLRKQTPSPLRLSGLEDVSFQFAETSQYTDIDLMDIDHEEPAAQDAQRIPLASLELVPSISVPEPASPKKSALRSPQKMNTKTPKKVVKWDDPEESELFLHDGPLQDMLFYVDVSSNGKDQNYLFASLLNDLGAKTTKDWNENLPSHVLFKDGSTNTLERVVASKGAIKCVNVGWVLDSEKNKRRMEEAPYLVDLSTVMPVSPLPTATAQPYTPARTPSKYALPPSSECKSIPTTPTSSEFDRSFHLDDKENSECGIYFDEPKQVRTVPPKKSSFLLSRAPIRTPSKPNFLLNTPVKPTSTAQAFSTGKKRCYQSSFAGISLAPPKRFRLF